MFNRVHLIHQPRFKDAFPFISFAKVQSKSKFVCMRVRVETSGPFRRLSNNDDDFTTLLCFHFCVFADDFKVTLSLGIHTSSRESIVNGLSRDHLGRIILEIYVSFQNSTL